MIRTMVVEDEPPIQRMIKTAIERANEDFSVTHTALNGKKAVELLEKERVDVVFTDIRMPVMDGLALAEWIGSNQPETLVVIVSGYQDFEYARQAIQLKAFDYLLKPLSPEKLSALLEKLSQELAQRAEKKKKELLSGSFLGEQRESEHDAVCAVILACAGAYVPKGSDALVPAMKFWNEHDVEQIMSELVREGETCLNFHANSPSEQYIVLETRLPERQTEIIQRFFERLSDGPIAVTVVFQGGVRLSEAGKYFDKLQRRLERSLILGKAQLLGGENTNSETDAAAPFTAGQMESALKAVRQGDAETLSARLREIFSSMQTAEYTQEKLLAFLHLLVDSFFMQTGRGMKHSAEETKRELAAAVAGFSGYNALAEDAASVLATLKPEEAPTESAGRRERLVESIESFLKENYQKSITNEVLARQFGFVPSYISRLFRQQRGVSPGEYLTRYRIELAKEILHSNRDMLVKEVADMVGFKEAYYFSKTFKKETGVWPSEYQK